MKSYENTLQILDIKSIQVDPQNFNVFNITAINSERNDPYWVEFLEPFFNDINIGVDILSYDQINKSKKWIINLDINMWNWNKCDDNINLLELFNVNILDDLRIGNAYLILNHQCEAFTNSFFDLFYSKFKKFNNIPYNKIIYMVAAADAEMIYQQYIKKNKIEKEKQIKIMYVHHVYKRIKKYHDMNSFLYEKNNKKEKKFISLNRLCHDHRLLLVSALSGYNLLSSGYVSLGAMPRDVQRLHNRIKELVSSDNKLKDILLDGFLKIKDKFPLQIDQINLNINHFQPNSLPTEFYKKSCFSLVSSTNALENVELSVNFTEKEIKPILYKHPFIIYNRPGVLKHLKNMGFLTFEQWFDESYDNEFDDMKRLEMIVKEVERLCKISFDKWEIILNEMKPVIDHNFNRLIKYDYEHCFFNSDLKKMLYYV